MTRKEKEKHYDNIMKKRKETQERHSKMVCKTFEVKIQENSLSKEKLEILKLVFIEGKWFYNDILRSGDIKEYDTKNNSVKVYNFETKRYRIKTLQYIDVHMKQYLKQQALDSIKGLSALKAHGYNVGFLKFKKECKSLHIQDKSRIKIIDEHYISIPVLHKIRVNGLEQFINDDVEIACADIIKKPNDYYLKITTYISKNKDARNKNKKKKKINKTIGIDFGIKNSYTLSDGTTIDTKIPESEILKRLQKKFSRTQKNSKNHSKLKRKIQIEYQKIYNRRKDLANKLKSELSRYDKVIIQDELLNKWKGKGISYDSKGLVKSKLKELKNVVVLDSSLPTTQFCNKCGKLNKIPLSQRIYKCSCSRKKEDRDIHAAKNMIWFYDHSIKSFNWNNRERELKKIQKKI